MKLLLTFGATEDEIARVRDGLPAGCTVVAPTTHGMTRFEVSHADVAELCPEAEAFLGWVVPPESWAAAPRLGALAWLHAGCDELDFDMLGRRAIQVCNIRGANAITVAEQAMTLMLGVARRVAERHQWVQEGHWQPTWHPDYTGVALEGRTLAIIGLGMIGTAIARRAKAFDMRVIGVRRHPERGGEFADSVQGPHALHEVLAEADFVILATPITSETVGFIDAAAIHCMKPSAFLINIARGNLIAEQALLRRADPIAAAWLRGRCVVDLHQLVTCDLSLSDPLAHRSAQAAKRARLRGSGSERGGPDGPVDRPGGPRAWPPTHGVRRCRDRSIWSSVTRRLQERDDSWA